MSQNPFAPPKVMPSGSQFQSAAAQKLRPAAIALLTVAIIGLLGRLLVVAIFLSLTVAASTGNMPSNPNEPPPELIFGVYSVVFVFMCGIDCFAIFAANRMRQGKSWGVALTGAIIQITCGGCGIISMGIAIWSIVVLSDANVKAYFNRR